MQFLNVSAYKFITLNDRETLREDARRRASEAGLRGTILLAEEGINLFLAGEEVKLRGWLAWLKTDARFADLEPKESWSDHQPFNRMLVKLKSEIITMRQPQLRPEGQRAPAVAPTELKRWLDQGHDDQGRPVTLLDTRNDYEVRLGTFTKAIDPQLKHFSHFTDTVAALDPALKAVRVVTFCTGGIRCEKAALYMQNEGFAHVTQLDGGILKYFEEVGGAHYSGDCFVFDRRTAVNPALQETGTVSCFACRGVVTVEEQRSPGYVFGKHCPACVSKASI